MKRISIRSLLYCTALILLFYLALGIRALIPYGNVFTTSFVRFGGADPWYHVRLLENTLHHFPARISYDPFTYFPYGAAVDFPPLFDQMLAAFIWLVGRGEPMSTLGLPGIEAIAAWYPAVLGALTVIPVYFIGKHLYNRPAGLFAAALIAVLPGQFLTRSMLGFTDHHVAETLFSTIAMLFIILAIISAREHGISFRAVQNRAWRSLRLPIFYSVAGGFFLGCYFLTWVGAPLFVFIMIIYAVVMFVIDHLRGRSTDYLGIVNLPVLLVSLAMILPVWHSSAFTEFQVLALFIGIAVFGVLTCVSLFMTRRNVRPYWYPLTVLAIGILALLLLYVLNPSLYTSLIAQLGVFMPSESFLTIAEVNPLRFFSRATGGFVDGEVWQGFTTTFFVAFAAIVMIGYNIQKRWRPEEILFFVWSFVMLCACFGQCRFAAYYAVNVAILCGFFSWAVIDFVKTRKSKNSEVPEGTQKQRQKKKGGAGSEKAQKQTQKPELSELQDEITGYLRADVLLTLGVILLVVFLPPLHLSLAMAKPPGGPDYDWYESLSWMRGNTSDPGLNYYAQYEEPRVGEAYSYPESAYSVMCWWGKGHWITRIAHRIPVANNFQQGIGGPYQGNSPGACVFFMATTESAANEVADVLDVRYVVTDFTMADAMASFANEYWSMTFWANDTRGHYDEYRTETETTFVLCEKYFNTMMTRLHMFDGREVVSDEYYKFGQSSGLVIQPFLTEPLRHYRLVHESPTYMMPYAVLNGATKDIQNWDCNIGNYSVTKEDVAELYQGIPAQDNHDSVHWSPRFFSPVSFVKVFEYVRGAEIEVQAPDGAIVEISTNITTNQGREFVYSQMAVSNGSYLFVVPYSTGANLDVLASLYKIKTGHMQNGTIKWDVKKEVAVTEDAVLEGKAMCVVL